MSNEGTRSGVSFPTTRWSLVVSAGEEAGPALEALCAHYWKPIYGFLRGSGYDRHDAEDLTQAFFARLLKGSGMPGGGTIKGRLRSYLLGSLKRHIADHYRRENAEKRGGGKSHFSLAGSELDFESAESRFVEVPSDGPSPDRFFDQTWAHDLLKRAHVRIRKRYEDSKKLREYELLKSTLVGGSEIDFGKVSEELGVSPSSVRVFAHRLRRNFRAAIQDEIADTVSTGEEVEEELEYLLQVFGS